MDWLYLIIIVGFLSLIFAIDSAVRALNSSRQAQTRALISAMMEQTSRTEFALRGLDEVTRVAAMIRKGHDPIEREMRDILGDDTP